MRKVVLITSEGVRFGARISWIEQIADVIEIAVPLEKRERWNSGYHIEICPDKSLKRVKNIGEAEGFLRLNKPDLIIVAGCHSFIPERILKIPKRGAAGFHPTLLPRGRGHAPIINTILLGEKPGLTLFYLNERMDAGDIIDQEEFALSNLEKITAQDVYERVIESGVRLLQTNIYDMLDGAVKRKPQDEKKATYFQKRTGADNRLDFEKDSVELMERKVRAFSTPYFGAYIEKDGKRLIVERASCIS
ncbi:MAG: hypothetical protein M1530_03345 [Candidatus Marsarchaeota archaeon]|nr:hypothetical protein [Candidatus Marsarchaeota archaeon]